MNKLLRTPVGADLSCPPPIYRPPGNPLHTLMNLLHFIIGPYTFPSGLPPNNSYTRNAALVGITVKSQESHYSHYSSRAYITFATAARAAVSARRMRVPRVTTCT